MTKTRVLITAFSVTLFAGPSSCFVIPEISRRQQKRGLMLQRSVGDGHDKNRDESLSSRRDVLNTAAKTCIGGFAAIPALTSTNKADAAGIQETSSAGVVVRGDVPISASWSAVDGLNSNDQNTVAFDAGAYRAMRDDPTRTPLFQKAIFDRLGSNPESQTVLDLGTGPYALFAIIAAELGAGKVYAIEANPAAAQSARYIIKRKGFEDVITVLEGFSSKIELPQKADFCIAEIVGSIASEEGAYASVRDAHQRFLKNPTLASSWIPNRMQTYAAPVSYSLHNLFGPPEFDWTKLNGEPVRFNCRDKGLELLADPVLVEDISFCDIMSKDQERLVKNKNELSFVVDSARMEKNELSFYDEFRKDNKSSKTDSLILARTTSRSISGIALWPRLVLDDITVIDSRHFGDGDHQRSHWQTVLPIMAARPVGGLEGGERVTVTANFELTTDVTKPCKYSLDGKVRFSS
jgi:hypothetical protein